MSNDFSRPVRPPSWLVALAFTVPVLPYVVAYVAFPISHLWLPDDAFYYFEIARNIAQGRGSTFDGINPTNGYHPLWQFLLAGISFVVPSRRAFVTVAILLQCALVAWAFATAFRLVFPKQRRRELIGAAVVAILLTWNYYAAKAMINGLESSLYLAAGVVLLFTFSRVCAAPGPVTVRRAAAMGLAAAWVIISRLDGVFFVAGVMLTWFLYRPSVLRDSRRSAVVACGIPVTALLGYMLVNQTFFGLWMPVSGYIKRLVKPTGASVLTMATFLVFVPVILSCLRVALGGWPARIRGSREAVIVALSACLVVYQADGWLVRGALVPEIWYLSQHVLWVFMILAVLWDRLMSSGAAWVRWVGTTAVVLAGVAGIAATWRLRLQQVSVDHYVAVREAAGWINAHLPKDAVLAGWDSGMLGFYTDPPVVNLDGLVNSAEYMTCLKENRTLEFMDAVGVEYVVQYYKPTFKRRGLDVEEFWRRVPQVLWSREITFAPMETLIRSGRRVPETYRIEIRKYQRARVSDAAIRHSPFHSHTSRSLCPNLVFLVRR